MSPSSSSSSFFSPSLSSLLSHSVIHVSFFIDFPSFSHLPYYGPVLRGWFGSHLFDSPSLHSVFCDSLIPFRPYFFYTTHNSSGIFAHFLFLDSFEDLVSEFVHVLSGIKHLHIAGKDASLSHVQIRNDFFSPLSPSPFLRIRLISPTSFYRSGKPCLFVDFSLLLDSLVRSVNRFNKFHLLSCYPIHWDRSWRNIPVTVENYDLRLFSWNQHRRKGKPIKLEGIFGEITYKLKKMNDEIGKLLSLAKFYQIGSKTSYGFGKFEIA